ncbi:MAG TPA: hypothetical protein PL196_06765, partial [Burkholderiaceae bacterium]|nr:hypothetical protein [Burkholderiaceae bacterium]
MALASLVLLVTAGAAALTLWSTRSVLQSAATQRNEASAHAMAAALAQLGDAPAATQQFLAAQWATGAWRSLRYEAPGE